MSAKSAARLTDACAKGNLIGGKWSTAGARVADVNPSNLDDVVGYYVHGSVADVHEAVAAARVAAPAWRASSPQVRADILDRAGSEILARREELGCLLAREEGKTLPEAVGEVGRAGTIFKFFAGEALRLGGEVLPSTRDGVSVEVVPEPVGVVALITPWNFPIAIPAWKTAPALAYGNCVVLKPAELVPACAWELADILARAGVPPGVFNLVMGAGPTIGAALVEADIDALSFTGSAEVGRMLAFRALPRLIKLQLEMGGKNPLVILDDADLDVAVSCAVQGTYYSTGQRCTASSRIIVADAIYDSFLPKLIAAVRSLRVGDALEPETDIGPAVDRAQFEKNHKYLNIAQEDGATLLVGGNPVVRKHKGYYFEPVLWADTTCTMRINREEIFGPMGSVLRARDDDEAVGFANDSAFGLCAGVCTSSLRKAARFKRDLGVGMVMVNLPTAGVDHHVPFGGSKRSSYGPHEQGTQAREFYTKSKTVYIAP